MKNIKILAGLVLLFAAFISTSCETEPIDSAIDLNDFTDTNNPAGPAVFKADFSGSTWVAETTQANITNNTITIVGNKGTAGEGFAFQVSGTAIGTYSANENLMVYTPANSDYGYWSIDVLNGTTNTGAVVITAVDTVNHTISGTFNFTGYWSDTTVTNILPTVFTNGVFDNIPYTTESIANNDSFSAKFEGVDFVEDNIDAVQILNESNVPVELSIVGSKTNDDSIGIRFPYSLEVGTYSFASDTPSFGGNAVINNILYHATVGTITIISKSSTRIKGTFSYTGYNFTEDATKQITEGTFDVEYN